MVHTEIRNRGNRRNYYRSVSVRTGARVRKRRVFLGSDLEGEELNRREREADLELDPLGSALDSNDLRVIEAIMEYYASLPKSTYEDRYRSFVTSYTHSSISLDGNGLTLEETMTLLLDSISPPSRPLKDLTEALNHKEALDMILSSGKDLSKDLVLELHRVLMKGTLDQRLGSQIGCYRTVQVFHKGKFFLPPSPEDVQREMAVLLRWYSRNKVRLHPLVVAANIIVKFELIHPFIEGNGRMGRLLLNLVLHRNGYPMVAVPGRRKGEYLDRLERAQRDGDLKALVSFLVQLMGRNSAMI